MKKGFKRVKSAYSKMSKESRVEIVAEHKAIEFLYQIYDGYDQDSTPRFETNLGNKFKFLDVPEQIPVVSDTNVDKLKNMLLKFYKRQVNTRLK